VNPLDFPLLTDENIHPQVVQALAAIGKDVVSVLEQGLGGHADHELLRRARELGRVVLTHDSDFGALAIRDECELAETSGSSWSSRDSHSARLPEA